MNKTLTALVALNLFSVVRLVKAKEMLPDSSRLLIHMTGFNQDTSWAMAMEQVIQQAQNNIHMFHTLPELLYFLSEEYRTYKLSKTLPEESVNKYYETQDLQNFGQKRTTVLKTSIEARYLPYLQRVKQLLGESPLHQAKLTVKGKSIPLTVTQKKNEQYLWVHTSPEVFPSLFTEMHETYQKIQWLKKQNQSPSVLQIELENVAKLHWLLVQTMPYERGSAGIADILTKVLLDALRIKTYPWRRGLSPDLEALTLPINIFIQRYTRFFETPPEADAEPQVVYPMEFPEFEKETSTFSA